ncbi:intramembrane glutamic endopeptidase MroQ [Staphylococcus lutrae]|uniref:CPBP family intramembrane metalloprotease n=1 Tax=Staphylococcus lutrae TaxID=155085 RepID=A0AAC9RNA1_9STAP|nr:type II CAAX endopeptidase family protein [Staphylococcus lutrae]ARJ50211.1 CPBP family intramembrane metalloprotease [Staphylococcus lutrae]PNZ35007.1 CPBP family intramembrane metalloprotease [Staphylococcus lutrae]
MNRIWVSLLTVLLYIFAQFSTYFALAIGWIQTTNQEALLQQSITIQVIAFIIVAFIIVIMQFSVKNKLSFEQGTKEKKRYILPYILVGLGIVFLSQIIVNLFSVHFLGASPASENTLRIIKIARQMPVFIVLIAIVGPLLEEFVFRKVLFGELYQAIRARKGIKFAIATTISSTIFAVAHMDFSHFLAYFVMGIIFSGFYVYTKRLSVAMGIHMAQNGIVALIQLMLPQNVVEEAVKHTSMIHLFVNTLQAVFPF